MAGKRESYYDEEVISKRQEQIIHILQSGGWKTGTEIAETLGVTSRTVRHDIALIREIYPSRLEASVRNGYRMKEGTGLHPLKTSSPLPQTASERQKYILLKLLTDAKSLNLMQVSADLYISSNTIDNDLAQIRSMLSGVYEDLKLQRKNGTIYLLGSEQSKRRLYKDMLANETAGNFLNLNELDKMYEHINLLEIKEILEAVLQSYDYKIREDIFPFLMIHIGVSLDRLMKQNLVQNVKYDVARIHEKKEYQISRRFYEIVSQKLGLAYNDNECILLAVLLMGKRAQKVRDESEAAFAMNELIDEIIDRIEATYAIDFRRDENLKVGLNLHITNLLDRIQQNVKLENVFLKEIKSNYPLIFEMAVFVGNIIEEKGMHISEEELGFLALHLGAAYDRLNLNRQYHTVLIQPSNVGLSTLCQNKITDHFSDRLTIDATLQYFEKRQIMGLAPDLILTTVPLQHDLAIPTVQISMFMAENDEFKIFKALNDLDHKRLRDDFSRTLKKMLKEEFFYRHVNLSSMQEILSFLCREMEEKKCVKKGFYDSVIARETLSSTGFAPGFAVPHPLHFSAIHSTISIALLQEPVRWGEYEVKTIFLLAIRQEDREAFRLFWDWLSAVSEHPKLLAQLHETKSMAELIRFVTAEQENI